MGVKFGLILRKENSLIMSGNKMLRKICGCKRKQQEEREKYIMKNFIICILHRILQR
jgi:hypothetical protein